MKKILIIILVIAILAAAVFGIVRWNFNKKYISSDEALSIAATDANVNPMEITDISVDFEKENGVAQYEVEFDVGLSEYEYIIDPVTGIIVDKRVEG